MFLSLLFKGIIAIFKAVGQLIAFFGLWIAMLFCVVFFSLFLYNGWAWEAVSIYFYIGLAISLALGFLWFCRFKLGIGKRKKNKKNKKNSNNKNNKNNKNKPAPIDDDDEPNDPPKKKGFFSL